MRLPDDRCVIENDEISPLLGVTTERYALKQVKKQRPDRVDMKHVMEKRRTVLLGLKVSGRNLMMVSIYIISTQYENKRLVSNKCNLSSLFSFVCLSSIPEMTEKDGSRRAVWGIAMLTKASKTTKVASIGPCNLYCSQRVKIL